MATAKKCEYSITTKIKLGETKYEYIGTLTLGTEYVTAGEELIEASESRYKFPSNVDFVEILPNEGFVYQFVGGSTNKIKVWGGAAAEKVVMKELASESTAVNGLKVPFRAIGS